MLTLERVMIFREFMAEQGYSESDFIKFLKKFIII